MAHARDLTGVKLGRLTAAERAKRRMAMPPSTTMHLHLAANDLRATADHFRQIARLVPAAQVAMLEELAETYATEARVIDALAKGEEP